MRVQPIGVEWYSLLGGGIVILLWSYEVVRRVLGSKDERSIKNYRGCN